MSKKKEVETPKYFLRYEADTYEIEPADPGTERYRYMGSSGLRFSCSSISRDKPFSPSYGEISKSYNEIYDWEDIPVGGPAYVVVALYRTGDTFGSHGEWTVVGVLSSLDKARALVDKCNQDDYSDHRPWDGYFEHLNSVELYPLVML